MAKRSPAIPAHIKEGIQKVNDFYERGKAVQARIHQNASFAEVAKEFHCNEDTLRKAAVFVDPERGYSPKELQSLIQRVERHACQSPSWQFGPTHIVRLISVKKGADRTSLQTATIDNEWSCSQLDDAIRLRLGVRRKGGRRRKVPTERAELLMQIAKECDRWQRWFRSMQHSSGNGSPLAQLPVILQADILQVMRLVSRLKVRVTSARE